MSEMLVKIEVKQGGSFWLVCWCIYKLHDFISRLFKIVILKTLYCGIVL